MNNPSLLIRLFFVLSFFVPLSVLAQENADPSAQADQFAGYLSSRSECLTEYKYGSVLFDFGEEIFNQAHTAGQKLIITGNLVNTNAYPLPEGRIYAHVLRQDETVAGDNWHPVVDTFEVPGDFSLTAGGEKTFTATWAIPSGAPSGLYRVEFFYLAGNRYVFSGLPYAPNASTGAVLFSVSSNSNTSYPEFDRSSVTLQNNPITLRSVPPTLNTDGPVSISATLKAIGDTPIQGTLTTSLYSWSITDNAPPVTTSSREITLDPISLLPVSFTWDQPQPGAYELLLTFTPNNPALLSSILKFRFPVEGNVPRLIFSGVTGTEGENAVITTCTVNASKGQGSGSVSTTIYSNGVSVGSVSGITDAEALSTTKTLVSLSDLKNGFSALAQTYDHLGNLVDSNATTYTADLVASLASPEDNVNLGNTVAKATLLNTAYTLGAYAVALLVVAVVIYWLFGVWRIQAHFSRNNNTPN